MLAKSREGGQRSVCQYLVVTKFRRQIAPRSLCSKVVVVSVKSFSVLHSFANIVAKQLCKT